MPNFTITQNVQVIKEFDSVTSDNTTSRESATGYCSWLAESYTNLYAGLDVSDILRAYIEWDVSSMKHVSSIEEVWLITDYNTSEETTKFIGIRGGQPSVSSATDVSNWIESGTTYISEDWDTTFLGTDSDWKFWAVDLGSSARTDLLNDVSGSTDFFAVGIQSDDEGDSSYQLTIRRSTYTWSEPPEPILYVKYTVNNVVTILQPRNLDRDNKRFIDFHQFKSGRFSRDDIGGSGKVIRMTGTESDTGSETSLANIDDMAALGEAVTLSGFNDASLNTTWLIDNFKWQKRGGYDEAIYDWELILVEPSG